MSDITGARATKRRMSGVVKTGSLIPHYNGEYEFTSPIESDVIIPTANKLLSKDLVIKKIPYKEEENAAGGLTVTIGGD